MKISMIAAVGENLELGKKGDLIWHLPNDLKFFKETTLGKPVVMGRTTYFSLPKHPLPKRRNIVLTFPGTDPIEGVDLFYDIPTLINTLKEQEEEIFIIGGASIYKQFIEYADNLYLTEIKASCPDADVYFPTFDKNNYDREVLKENSDNNINYEHVLYKRR